MENQIDSLLSSLSSWQHYAEQNILTRELALQIGLIILVFITSYYLRKILVRTFYELGRNQRDKIIKYQSQIKRLKAVLFHAIAASLLWGVTVVMAADKREHEIIRIVAILLLAWAIIRLISIFIASPRFARSFEIFSWVLAALAILGWLNPVINGIDSVGFTMGETRISIFSVIKAIFMLAVFFWAAHHLSNFLKKQIEETAALSSSLQVLLSKIIQFSLMGLAVMLGLGAVGIDLTAFAVFTGALGVGIGFGLQKIISNFISGIILLLDRSLKPGDVIEVETAKGPTYGWIEKLGLRYTSVTTRDGTETLIPNETFITNPVTNWSFSNSKIRHKLPIGVSYKADVELALKLCVEAAKAVPRVLDHPSPVCQLRSFGDSSVNLEIRFWIEDPKSGVRNVESDVNLNVWKAFRENDIEIPFPQRDVHLFTGDGQPLRLETVIGKAPRHEATTMREQELQGNENQNPVNKEIETPPANKKGPT